VRHYLRAHGISVLHTHGYRTDVLGYLASRGLEGIGLVTTHHGWIRNSMKADLLARGALQLTRCFDGVELVANYMRHGLPRAVRHAAHTVVLYNGIVLRDYCDAGRRHEMRQSLGISDGQALVGVIGRLSPEKGSVEMLDAFATIAGRRSDARLLFVGEGPLAATLQGRAALLGLSDRVQFAGHHPQVQPFFEAIDVLVSPSRTEGLSNVILEALALRCPVVATHVGGNGEILSDGSSGLLVPARQPEALAQAVLRILDDAALRQRICDGGRRRVEAFSFDTRMREEERFYTAVLESVRRRSPRGAHTLSALH
jgi:glycosyltransferase involved in cell wall biosynthesis